MPTDGSLLDSGVINKTPPPSYRKSHNARATATDSPLLNNSSLAAEQSNKIKNMKAKDQNQQARGVMDVIHSKEEMASCNLRGKRKKRTTGQRTG